MTGNNKFVFLESNTTGTGELLLGKAVEKGLHPIFMTSDPNKYLFLSLKSIEVIVIDSSNKDVLLDYLANIENLTGIYSSSEYYIETASWLAHKLGLPGANVQSIKSCRNKYLLYQAVVSSELNVPHTQRAFNLNEATNALSACDFPLIIKPSSGSGSGGVRLCKSKADSLQHIHSLFQNNCHEVLIQEYIDAPEYSAEVLSLSGQHKIIGITKKYLSDPPYFVEIGHDFRAVLSMEDEDKIQQAVKTLLSILNYDFGFSHIEFKIKNGNVVIIEVNPRLAGGMIPVLIEKATGLDVLNKLLDMYTNNHIDMAIKYKRFASIRHFIPSTSGRIKSIKHKNMDGIDEVKIIKNSDDIFTPQGDFRDRVACVIVSDDEPRRCSEKANEALKNFDIVIEPIV